MAITNMNEICRLCLDNSIQLYNLESDFCILVMESGASVTIADALKYLDMNLKIPMEKEKPETADEDENEVEAENSESNVLESDDDPNLPKSLCQDCLEKLQSAYEFKFRCEENKTFLKNYLKECADSKLAEERAAKEAALLALDIDIDNLDDLPDKLVLKEVKKEKRTRRPRDPSKPAVKRKRRIAEKNVIIADDSQLETAAYVRKMITTPEQSPDQKGRSSKRKSKHVIIEDVIVVQKPLKKSIESKHEEEATTEEEPKEKVKEKKPVRADDEPIFEDDSDFEQEPPKKNKRTKK